MLAAIRRLFCIDELSHSSRVFAVLTLIAIFLASTSSCPASEVTYTYNAAGQLIKATYNDGIVVTYAYDANGNRISATTSPPSVLTPTNLSATDVSETEIDLTWTGSSGATGYYVDRCEGAGCTNFVQIGVASNAAYADTGLIPGDVAETFVYEVQAYDTSKNAISAASTPASAQLPADTTPPTTPTDLTAAASAGSIALNWSASSDALGIAGYDIARCAGSGCDSFSEIATVGGTTYTDSGLSQGDTYQYEVRAFDAVPNYSGWSNVASAMIPITTPPSVPTGLTAAAVNWSTADLSWSASTDAYTSVAGYDVYRDGAKLGTTSGTSYADNTTSPSTTYSYTVAAYDSNGNTSAQSNSASVTTLPAPTPSPPSGLSGKPASDNAVALSWTAATDAGGPGIAGYDIYRNGTEIGTTAGTSYTDSGLPAFTWSTYSVSAYDKFGTKSAQVSVDAGDSYQITNSSGNSVASGYTVQEGTEPIPGQTVYTWVVYAPNGQEVASAAGTGVQPVCYDPNYYPTTVASGYYVESCDLWAEPSAFQN